MRRVLGPLLLGSVLGAGLLTGCAGDDTARDPESQPTAVPVTDAPSTSASDTPSSTGDPTDDPTDIPTKSPPITPPSVPTDGGVEHTVVALESATAAGGTVDPTAVAVRPGGDMGDVLSQLTDPSFRELVEQRITFSRAAGDLYAAIVAVGCDTPPGVYVTEVDGGYAITAQKVVDPLPNCFAPVTTVAVVAIP